MAFTASNSSFLILVWPCGNWCYDNPGAFAEMLPLPGAFSEVLVRQGEDPARVAHVFAENRRRGITRAHRKFYGAGTVQLVPTTLDLGECCLGTEP